VNEGKNCSAGKEFIRKESLREREKSPRKEGPPQIPPSLKTFFFSGREILKKGVLTDKRRHVLTTGRGGKKKRGKTEESISMESRTKIRLLERATTLCAKRRSSSPSGKRSSIEEVKRFLPLKEDRGMDDSPMGGPS